MRLKTGFELQKEFHEAFGHPVNTVPGFPDELVNGEFSMAALVCGYIEGSLDSFGHSRRGLRIKLLLEEVAEYLEAEGTNDITEVFDALVDIEVIADGTAHEYGLPLDHGREEIHSSNMSKLGEDGKPIHREDGKIMKGPNYKAPDLAALIEARRLPARVKGAGETA